MCQLCFSSIVKLLKQYFSLNNSDIGIGKELLLDEIVRIYNIYDKNGNYVDINKSKISNLMNQKMDIPESIKHSISNMDYYDKFFDYVKTNISPYINNNLLYDFYYELIDIINKDSSISPKMKDKLNKLYDNDNESLLTNVILYSLSKTNLPPTTELTLEDNLLISEQNHKCVKCKNKLIKRIKTSNKVKSNFIKLSFKYNDDQYFSLLFCRDCADEYSDPSTLTKNDLKMLKKVKEDINKRVKTTEKLYKIGIEEDLKIIIDKLSRTNFINKSDLSLNPLEVRKKIPEN